MEVSRFTVRNENFVCRFCGLQVKPLATGCRNHCPGCLHSVHLDKFPGDRAAACGGLMEPRTIEAHSKKGWRVVHCCLLCGYETNNKLALEDPRQPDDMEVVLRIMRQARV